MSLAVRIRRCSIFSVSYLYVCGGDSTGHRLMCRFLVLLFLHFIRKYCMCTSRVGLEASHTQLPLGSTCQGERRRLRLPPPMFWHLGWWLSRVRGNNTFSLSSPSLPPSAALLFVIDEEGENAFQSSIAASALPCDIRRWL